MHIHFSMGSINEYFENLEFYSATVTKFFTLEEGSITLMKIGERYDGLRLFREHCWQERNIN